MSLFHRFTEEGHPAQRGALYVFARHVELPLLRLSHRLLRGDLKRIGDIRLFRAALSRFVARPIATYGDTAKPIPYEELLRYIERVEGAVAVGKCRCRISHDPCGHPIETDIVIRTGTAAWLRAFPREYRIIDRAEAARIVNMCRDAGMFHTIFHHYPAAGDSEYVICNCCVCGCVPYVLNRDLGQKNFPFLRGDWEAETDMSKCRGNRACIASCPFEARVPEGDKTVTRGCFGCGMCVGACPEKAISLRPAHGRAGKPEAH